MAKLIVVAWRIGHDEEGATMVEYGLMLAFIALVCFSAVQTLGVQVNSIFPSISAAL